MARLINVDYAQIARIAIAHTLDNGYRFGSHGAMLSLRSPQSAALIKEINPMVADQGKRLSFTVVAGNPVPQVSVQFRPQAAAVSKSLVRRTKAATMAGVNTERPVISANVTYDSYHEYTEDFTQAQLLKLEPAAAKYLDGLNRGVVKLDYSEQQGIEEIGRRLVEKMDDAMFIPLNLACTTRLIAAIGTNLVDGSTAVALPTIVLFDAAGRPRHQFLQYMKDIRRAHNIKGKLVVVGGMAISRYFDALQISDVQDLGFDGRKILSEMPTEFYFDSEIDTNYGAGRIIIRDPGAAALEFVNEHGDVIGAKRVADTTYRRMAVTLAGYDSPTFTTEFDLRAIEDDTGAYPKILIVPSVRCGIFTRPAGVIKDFGPWTAVTGVYGAICA